MTKKILAFLLTVVMLVGCVAVTASAEEPAALTFVKDIKVIIPDTYVFTEGALTSFGITAELNDKNVVPIDGATTESAISIVEIKSRRSTTSYVTYDSENPDEFLNLFKFTEDVNGDGTIDKKDRESMAIDVKIQIDYKYAEVFGELSYTVAVTGFSAPPDLGAIGGLLGESVAVPTTIETEYSVDDFPSLSSISIANASTKMFYKDSEKPELDGIVLNVTTSAGETGTVTYAPANAHQFTTIPDKNEKLTIDDKEIVTYFYGLKLTTLPVSVEHDWSTYPVCITTDKWTQGNPGYHAIVCNGCNETHTAEPHVIDENAWVSNDDSTFVKNGTASQPCRVCGATVTKDVLGSADYNESFANYHFLKVIFDYINLIFRIIGGSIIG